MTVTIGFNPVRQFCQGRILQNLAPTSQIEDELSLDRWKLDPCRHLTTLPGHLVYIKTSASGETGRRAAETCRRVGGSACRRS